MGYNVSRKFFALSLFEWVLPFNRVGDSSLCRGVIDVFFVIELAGKIETAFSVYPLVSTMGFRSRRCG